MSYDDVIASFTGPKKMAAKMNQFLAAEQFRETKGVMHKDFTCSVCLEFPDRIGKCKTCEN